MFRMKSRAGEVRAKVVQYLACSTLTGNQKQRGARRDTLHGWLGWLSRAGRAIQSRNG